jgi:hypothetical protein
MWNKVTITKSSRASIGIYLVVAVLVLPFAVKAQGTATRSVAIDDPNARPPVTKADLRIVKRAREILEAPSKWNRADNRECPAQAKTFSLYCALQMATNEVSGKSEHRGAALQEARFVIDEIASNRNYNHRLMDYNNDPTTTFADIQEVFRITESLIALRLKAAGSNVGMPTIQSENISNPKTTTDSTHSDRQVAVLNGLRDEINLVYGYKDDAPRVNLGPCGRFAKAFREQWNARFKKKVNIVFVMTDEAKHCYHVLVKLPDGNYFDGGNGVISGPTLLRQYPTGTRLEEMTEFDLKRLDRWSAGLDRKYELCPNYSDETTAGVIERHLAMLAKD